MTDSTSIDLRDLQSGKTVHITATGKVLGREGGPADVGIPDRAVSGRHARVYFDGDRWLLEDLKSSNGTMVSGTRITRAIELRPGMRFALFRYEFEVLGAGGEGDGPTAIWDGQQDTQQDPPADAPIGTRPKIDRAASRTDIAAASPTAAASPPEDGAVARGTDPANFADEPLSSYLWREIPKAFAYYVVAVPILLFRPMQTIADGIAEQRFPPMGWRALIAYGFPALLLGSLLVSFGALVVTVAHGTFGVAFLISLFVNIAIALAISLVLAFLFHPVVGWIITRLKGESDAASRSNFFVMMQTALPLQQVAAFLGLLLSLVPLPFVGIVSPIVTLIATAIALLITYRWLSHFHVIKWAPLIVVVLGALTATGTVKAMFDTTRADIARIVGEPAKVVPVAVDSTTRPMTADSAGVMRQATEASTPAPQPLERAPLPATQASDYPRFVERRTRVEEAIDKDPTLLNRPGVLPLYRQLLKSSATAKQKYRIKLGKKPTIEQQVEAKIAERLRDAEIFDATSETVDKLYDELFEVP